MKKIIFLSLLSIFTLQSAFGFKPSYPTEEQKNLAVGAWCVSLTDRMTLKNKSKLSSEYSSGVEITCSVDFEGILSDIKIVKSSGKKLWDRSCVEMVRSISPVKNPPNVAVSRGLTIKIQRHLPPYVPVNFHGTQGDLEKVTGIKSPFYIDVKTTPRKTPTCCRMI